MSCCTLIITMNQSVQCKGPAVTLTLNIEIQPACPESVSVRQGPKPDLDVSLTIRFCECLCLHIIFEVVHKLRVETQSPSLWRLDVNKMSTSCIQPRRMLL